MRALVAFLAIGWWSAGKAADCEPVALGWFDRFDADRGWHAEPRGARAAQAGAAARFGPDGAVFEIGAPGGEMSWTRTTNPVWIASFPWVEVRYRLSPGTRAELELSDDSTGPVTPGALNPENPLASGDRVRDELPAGTERIVLDLTAQAKTDRIARISVRVTAPDGGGRLQLRFVGFWASEPREPAQTRPSARSWTDCLRPEDLAVPEIGLWEPLALPAEKTVSADCLARAAGCSGPWPAAQRVRVAGVPFLTAPADRVAVATGVMEADAVELRGQWEGSELALLLMARVFGSAAPAFAQGPLPPRRGFESPHELMVRLAYKDGTVQRFFPWSLRRRAWSVEGGPDAYVVPVDRNRLLTSVRIEEAATYGQVFVLAASLRRDGAAVYPRAVKRRAGSAVPAAPPPRSPAIGRVGGKVAVQTAWFDVVFDVEEGMRLERFVLSAVGREIVPEGQGTPVFGIGDQERPSIPLRLSSVAIRDGSLDACWSAAETGGRELSVRVESRDAELRMTPSLINRSPTEWRVDLDVARMDGVRISDDPEDRWYLLGTRSTILDHGPIEIERAYSSAWPLRLIDVFAPRAGGGLGLLVEHAGTTSHTYRFHQAEHGASWAVRFPDVRIPAGGRVDLPAAVLLAHVGDWHDLLRRYRCAGTGDGENAGSSHFRELFYCRRDYPLGGTDYLFDIATRRYTPQRLIRETLAVFGGVDMIDISGWAYNERTGRVGDYRTNDLGGLDELRRGVEQAHQRGVKVGLYFEGYLVDRRSALAERALPAWQLVDRRGRPLWWPGQMEFFVCPGVAAWREELSAAVADVAAATGADAVYVDEFGFGGADKACWSPAHGHPVPSNPLAEEGRMLATIRSRLDERSPKTAIYIEQIPCDSLMGWIDGAFNYGMVGAKEPQHPTKLPLFRYVRPEIVPIEMVGYGIRPIPVREDDLHLCVFHGLAVWLKGRGASWYTAGFGATAQRAYAILREHAAVFRSRDCEPLVPTLKTDLYANRFSTPDAVILTVYNAGLAEIEGDLVRTHLPAGWGVRDLWAGRPARWRRDGDSAVVEGSVAPRSVGVYLLSGSGRRP